MKTIAIIPARGGSKRIPRKNIKNFHGRPIISYAIELALKSNLFDEVMVTTDDEEIAQIAKQEGASVPFLRSAKNADDFATTADVLFEVFDFYEKQNEKFDIGCCIYPTSPLVQEKLLKETFQKLKTGNFDSVFPVLNFSYPIQRSLKIDNDKVKMVWPEHLNSRSQDLEERYHDAGQFYWFSISSFKEKKTLFTDNSGAVPISELEAQDIDNPSDWKVAELKYQLIQNQE
ncbi:MAG: pseudaminic acid cytidylyltransferase [Flavobacteriales bacterium]|nr:pseudaminic acid cytidylyltransferase [Flavobacteriales bacterium]